MTVRLYRNTDTGAPVLTGTSAGPIIAILDACLINGYGVDGVGTGRKDPAGWSKPFSGVNLAAYKQGAGSNGMYLRVNDTMTGTNRAARVVAFETMSDINTGTGQFPTNTQLAGGFWWPSVNGTDTHPNRTWIVVATEKFMYLYIEGQFPESTGSQMYRGIYEFGDPTAYKPGGDPYFTIVSGQTVQGLPSSQVYEWDLQQWLYNGSTFRYVARSHTGLGSSQQIGRHADKVKSSDASGLGVGGMAYPNPVDGGVFLSPIWLHGDVGAYQLRGEQPGMWNPCHPVGTFATGDTWQGTGPLAGKTFLVVRCYNMWAALEISDTW